MNMNTESLIKDFCRHAGMADDSWAEAMIPVFDKFVEYMGLKTEEERE